MRINSPIDSQFARQAVASLQFQSDSNSRLVHKNGLSKRRSHLLVADAPEELPNRANCVGPFPFAPRLSPSLLFDECDLCWLNRSLPRPVLRQLRHFLRIRNGLVRSSK